MRRARLGRVQCRNAQPNLGIRCFTSAARRNGLAGGSRPITDVESLSEHVQASYSGQKISAEMIAVYGACCLLVAMLGVYAAMASSVSERSREFALRMALRSERSRLLGLVMTSGLRVVLGGLVVGTVGAFFVVRVLKTLLFGLKLSPPKLVCG